MMDGNHQLNLEVRKEFRVLMLEPLRLQEAE